MRSQVVSGWPGLLVNEYDTAVPEGDLDSIDPSEGQFGLQMIEGVQKVRFVFQK